MELNSVAYSSGDQLGKCCLAHLEDFFLYRNNKKKKLEDPSLWSSQEWVFRVGETKEDGKVLEIKAEQELSAACCVKEVSVQSKKRSKRCVCGG